MMKDLPKVPYLEQVFYMKWVIFWYTIHSTYACMSVRVYDNYKFANQALCEYLTTFLTQKFDSIQLEINNLKDEVRKSCEKECNFEKDSQQNIHHMYLVGSSLLREV